MSFFSNYMKKRKSKLEIFNNSLFEIKNKSKSEIPNYFFYSKMNKKGSLWGDYLGWLLLGLGLLVFVIIAFIMLSGKLNGIAEYLGQLFRLRSI